MFESNVKEKESGIESRLSVRQEVLESFSVNLTIPQLGAQRIPLYDISRSGLSFNTGKQCSFRKDDIVYSFLEICNGIKIPITLKVMNIIVCSSYLRIGCEIDNKPSKAYDAFLNFVNLLNSITSFY